MKRTSTDATVFALADATTFVGRTAELNVVREWLEASDSPIQAIFISGIGGIGKTTLLRKIAAMTSAAGVWTEWIDGRALTELQVEPSTRPQAIANGSRLSGDESHSMVWCIDNCESHQAISGWIQQTVLSRMDPGSNPKAADLRILVVMASRNEPPLAWRSDPVWRGRWRYMPLDTLSLSESRELLHRAGVVDHPEADALLRSAKGHPLALALGIDALARSAPSAPGDAWGLPREISAHFLREVTAPEMHPFLDALAVLPEGDQDALAAVAGVPIRSETFHALAELSFVQPGPRGLSLHDVARGHLATDLRWRTPARFRALRRRAAHLLRSRMTAAHGPLRRRLASQLLQLCADAMSVDCAVSAGLPYVDGYHPDDLPKLRDLVARSVQMGGPVWSFEEYQQSLETVAAVNPGAIRIARHADGEPIAFTVQLALHRDSVQMLDNLLPHLLSFLPPSELEALRQTDPQSSDTSLCVTIGLETARAPFPSGEAVDVLMRDTWAGLSERRRALILLEGDVWRELFLQLGCKLYGFSDGLISSTAVFFADLDLRNTDFGDWAISLLERVDGETSTDDVDVKIDNALFRSTDAPVAEPRDGQLAAPPSEDEVRQALAAINDPEAFKYLPLTIRCGVDPDTLRERLTKTLTASPPPEPLDDDSQALLRATFLEPAANRSEVAYRFYLSRSSYYRHLKEGIRLLARALADRR